MATMRQHDGYVLGLMDAQRMLGKMRDPLHLRMLASRLEAKATAPYQFGVAAGMRLLADDLEDGISVPPSLPAA